MAGSYTVFKRGDLFKVGSDFYLVNRWTHEKLEKDEFDILLHIKPEERCDELCKILEHKKYLKTKESINNTGIDITGKSLYDVLSELSTRYNKL